MTSYSDPGVARKSAESCRRALEQRPNDEYLRRQAENWEAIADGRLIHVQDPRWSWTVASPVVGRFTVDGWEFVLRGWDPQYMVPSNGRGLWLTADLQTFTRGRSYVTHSGKCLRCYAPAAAGTVDLFTPSGRRFSACYRDECGCRAGGPGSGRVTKRIELNDALALLLSYFGGTEELTDRAKQLAHDWWSGKAGAMEQLFELLRDVGVPLSS